MILPMLRNERAECGWVPLLDGNFGRLFYSFGAGFLGQDGRRGCIVRFCGC